MGPRWGRYYISADQKLMAVPIELGATVKPGTPQPLFSFPATRIPSTTGFAYAPSRDGQRFLVNSTAGGENAPASPITVITNWQAAFK
jgi:hypothetical protein